MATNVDQKQSINLFNYKVDGSDFHFLVTSAKSSYVVSLTDYYDENWGVTFTYTNYIVPMVFITASNPVEITFMMG